MNKFTGLILILGSLLLMSTQVFTQGNGLPIVNGFEKPKTKKFISIDGEFKLDLPSQHNGFKGLNLSNTNEIGDGSLFEFRQENVTYEVGYINLSSVFLKMEKPEIEEKIRNLHKTLYKYSLQNLKIEKSTEKNKIIFNLSGEFVRNFLLRYVITDKKVYILTAKFFPDEYSTEEVLKIFDSLELFSNESIADERIKKATLPALPQKPSTDKQISDLTDEDLKGKVQTLLKEVEYLDKDASKSGKQKQTKYFFNSMGNIEKEYMFSDNLPTTIAVYGFENNRRIFKAKRVNYNPDSSDNNSKDNETFGKSFKYKYDAGQRIIQKLSFWNNGKLLQKEVFKYLRNKIERYEYNEKGKLSEKATLTLNKNGNVVSKISYWTSSPNEKYLTTYTYEEFDQKGNWTKRKAVEKFPDYNGKINMVPYIEYRTFTYYE